jgi:2-phospho-L-lactate guanylyltransferase
MRRILVPCKSFTAGKSRLAGTLSDAARAELCRALLATSLDVALACAGPSEICVVSAAPEVGAVAGARGVAWTGQGDTGLNAALAAARDALLAGQPAPAEIVILPTDLVRLDAGSFAAFLQGEGEVLIAPDRSGQGTNLLALRGAALALPLRFGTDSFAAHRAEAAQRGWTVGVCRDERLGFDLDTPQDYRDWQALRAG